MSEKIPDHPFEVVAMARDLGANIQIARKRRQMLQSELALKAGVSEKTIRRLEKGDENVSMANVLSALWVLGLLQTVRSVAAPDDDAHGKAIELARLPKRVRAVTLDNDF